MNKQLLNFGLRIVISISLLILLITRIDINNLVNTFTSIDVSFLILGILCFCLYIGAWTARWQIFIYDAGIRVNFFQTMKTLLIGFAISLFLPSAVGTDVGRTYDMARSNEQKVAILSTVFMDRLMGLLAVFGMAVVAIIIAGYQYLNEGALIAIVGATLALILGWVFFFNKRFMGHFRWVLNLPIINRFSDSLRELYNTIYYMQRKPRLFLLAVCVSVMTVMLEIVAVVLLSYAIGAKIDPIYFFVFMPIIWVILIIPISIGGLGLREAVFAFFFTQVGMDTTDAVALSLLYYTMYAVTGILAGALPVLNYIYSGMMQAFQTRPPSTDSAHDKL